MSVTPFLSLPLASYHHDTTFFACLWHLLSPSLRHRPKGTMIKAASFQVTSSPTLRGRPIMTLKIAATFQVTSSPTLRRRPLVTLANITLGRSTLGRLHSVPLCARFKVLSALICLGSRPFFASRLRCECALHLLIMY